MTDKEKAKEWLKKAAEAEAEANYSFSVGGLAVDLGLLKKEETSDKTNHSPNKSNLD
jgi:LAS superfamily LD-carboxypeptidase LdcB